MSCIPSLIRHPCGLLASTIAIAMLTTQAEAGRCAREDYNGASSLVVNAGRITASDIQNGSAEAWTKIADATQSAYGGNVNVGQVSMTVMIDVQPIPFGPTVTTALPMTITFTYSGQHSINQAVRDFANVPSEASGDPSPCDPQLNACCEECGAAFGWANPSEFFKSGFFTHEQLIAARLPQGSRKVVKKFVSLREAELA